MFSLNFMNQNRISLQKLVVECTAFTSTVITTTRSRTTSIYSAICLNSLSKVSPNTDAHAHAHIYRSYHIGSRVNKSLWVPGEEINRANDATKIVSKFINDLDQNHARIQWHRQQFGAQPPWMVRKRKKGLKEYKIKMTPIWKEKKDTFIENYLAERGRKKRD